MAYNTSNATTIGLGSVNNTSDVNKPISTATQAALNLLMAISGNTSISGVKTFTGEVILGGGFVVNRKALSDVNYTASTNDNYLAYTGLTTGRTITFVSAAAVPSGYSLTIKDAIRLSSLFNITILPNSTDTIDKLTSYILNLAGESITFISDGISNWEIN